MFNEHFRANQYFAVGGKALYLFNPNFHFRTEVFGYFPVQSILSSSGNTANYAQKVFTKAHFMGLAALVYQTRFGPLSAELNYYDKVGQKWFFSVNMGYMLFNKRGF
jgi:NTE family protein